MTSTGARCASWRTTRDALKKQMQTNRCAYPRRSDISSCLNPVVFLRDIPGLLRDDRRRLAAAGVISA